MYPVSADDVLPQLRSCRRRRSVNGRYGGYRAQNRIERCASQCNRQHVAASGVVRETVGVHHRRKCGTRFDSLLRGCRHDSLARSPDALRQCDPAAKCRSVLGIGHAGAGKFLGAADTASDLRAAGDALRRYRVNHEFPACARQARKWSMPVRHSLCI